MFTAEQYRARAVEYSQLVKIAKSPAEVSEFKRLERTFAELADNAQWAVDNYDKTLHATSGSHWGKQIEGRSVFPRATSGFTAGSE
jgi:hypothetical protein